MDKQTDAIQFEAALGYVAICTGKELDPTIKRAYWRALEDIPIATVAAALEQAATRCEYFPSVGEIRAFCDEVEQAARQFELTAPTALLPPGDSYQGDPAFEDQGPTYWCPECHDTTLVRPRVCRDGERCGLEGCKEFSRRDPTHTHTYTYKCHCTVPELLNPVVKRRLAEQRRVIEAGGKYFRPRKRERVPREMGGGE